VWAEIWPEIGPRIETVLSTGQATWDEALMLILERSGYPEETYHTFSYSPLADDDGAIRLKVDAQLQGLAGRHPFGIDGIDHRLRRRRARRWAHVARLLGRGHCPGRGGCLRCPRLLRRGIRGTLRRK